MTKSSGPVGVVAGTGVAEEFGGGRPKKVGTRFGRVDVRLFDEKGYVVVSRHGASKSPPHSVNYRANVEALSQLGVKKVMATNAVGSMNEEFEVGMLGLLGQFLDFTKGRQATFFDREAVHTDMTEPYSRSLNKELARAARGLGIGLKEGLVYVCAEGPRYETAAEVRMFRLLGGDVVGMTGVPEVVLARERQMEYASVVVATNWAAGIQEEVSHEEVVRAMKASGKRTKELIEATIKRMK
ncbi:MAG: MTAP family purine nucleoside phosphorylase [Thaumarchaeota archaeon]|nr:MTAP family purine nucleoside phosphorylase [Nitrososphaerota archaeon]